MLGITDCIFVYLWRYNMGYRRYHSSENARRLFWKWIDLLLFFLSNYNYPIYYQFGSICRQTYHAALYTFLDGLHTFNVSLTSCKIISVQVTLSGQRLRVSPTLRAASRLRDRFARPPRATASRDRLARPPRATASRDRLAHTAMALNEQHSISCIYHQAYKRAIRE